MRFLLCTILSFSLLSSVLYSQNVVDDIISSKGIGGKNITAYDRIGERKIGGYFDNEFKQNSTESSFIAHRLILQVSSQVDENVFFNTEIEYEYGGAMNSLGNQGELKIEQGWVDIQFYQNHYFRSGIVLVPFGIVNILHDSDVRDTTVRPIYSRYIVPSTWFDTGAGFHGSFDVSDWEFTYEAYVLNGLNGNITSDSGLKSAKHNLKKDNNKGKAIATRVSVSPFLGLEVAGNLYTGTYDEIDSRRLVLSGVDAFWKKGPFEFLGEVAQASTQSTTNEIPNTLFGYYTEGRYHFMPNLMKSLPFIKGFERPVFTAFGRYSVADLDTSVSNTNDVYQTTLGLNYRPTPTTVFKAEIERLAYGNSESVKNTLWLSVAVGF